MTNRKTTRRALVLSLLSLLLCCSMLVGTTFAWFTDSVTSGNNRIVAGNLDIELDYSMDLQTWKEDITTAGDIFVAPAGATKGLWEPGHTEVAYLRITNAGTLALKYQLQVNPFTEVIGENADGDPIQLSKILKFAATEASATAPTAYTRETAQAAALAGDGTALTEYTTKVTTMMPGDVQYIALVVYMPEEVGNEANYKTGTVAPSIEFALNLRATQVEAEYDSFGNDYDKDTDTAVTYVGNYEELLAALNEGGNIQLMDDVEIADTAADTSIGYPVAFLIDSGKPVVLDLNGKTLKLTGQSEDAVLIHALNTDVTIKGDGKMSLDNEGAYSNLIWAKGTAKVTIESGEFVSTNPAAVMLYVSDDNGNKAQINIVGGEFTSAGTTAQNHINIRNHGLGKVNIMGGTFNYNPDWSVYTDVHAIDDADHITIAEGYKALNTGSTWMVVSENTDYVTTSDELVSAINSAADSNTILVAAGDYALRFTNNTAFNVDNLTIQGLGEVKLAVSSSEVWYGRVQGSNVTFENIDFTTSVGATGKATYNDCTFVDWTICASSNNEETYFNNCTINGCLNTSTDFSSGNVYVKDSTVAKAEYSGAAIMNFDGCTVGELITWNMATNLNNTTVENLDLSHVTDASVKIDGVAAVQTNEALKAVVAEGALKVKLLDGQYDLNGIQKDGLTLTGIGTEVKVANTTKYASGKAVGAIWKAIHLENVTITNTVYTMADGGNATFKNVYFAAGFRQGYGKSVVFEGCTFGSNSEGYALHFQTDSASEGGDITLNGCKFEGGKVHLGGKRAYTFTGCDFAAGTDFQVWSNITLEGCTVNGETVTAENAATLFPNLDLAKVTIQ